MILCDICPSNTYTSIKKLGWYITENATKSINRNCSKCMNGYFTSNINEYECKLWTVCDEGTYISRNGTDINDIECDICPSNTHMHYQKTNIIARNGPYVILDGT